MDRFGMEGLSAAFVWDRIAASVRMFPHSFMGV